MFRPTPFALAVPILFLGAGAIAQPTVFSSAGTDAEVTAAVNAYRAALGVGASNANIAGSFLSGRREINWDAVPDAFSAPNVFPGAFFNGPATGRARGVEFSTPGTGFETSANAVNPTSTPINFGDIDSSYVSVFRPFTAQRLFTPVGSNVMEIRFFIPGQSSTRATVSGFGAVFSDVDLAGSTRINYFDQTGSIIGSVSAPPSGAGSGGFSFVGALFTHGEKIWRVSITTGTQPLGAGVLDDPAHGVDLVVMDDFLYGEPVTSTHPQRFASGGADQAVTDAVNAYRAALGTLNPNTPGSFGSGRREINWDAVPDAASAPNNLAADFFNGPASPRARGAVFSTPGTGFQVSANAVNPTNTPVEFGNLDPSYPSIFRPFSTQKLFTAIGSGALTVNFFVPGAPDAASVTGFGAVFSDVDLPTSTRIDYRDRNGGLLDSVYLPIGAATDESFSFLGELFGAPYRVASVTIQSGTAALGAGVVENIPGGVDLVSMDDFLYGEPVLQGNCAADYDGDGVINTNDFFAFLNNFFANDADFNHDGATNSQDFYDFLTAFFIGC